MATGLSSPLGVTGIILIIIGIIMAIIGVILLIANQNKEKPWYIWVLIVGGIILGIIGGILLAVALSRYPEPIRYVTPQYPVVTPQYMPNPQYVAAAPVPVPVPQYIPGPPAPQYVQAPPATKYVQAPQYVQAQHYVQVPQYAPAPPPAQVPKAYTQRTEFVDDDLYDPDPKTYVNTIPGQNRRMDVIGPYGPGGQQVQTSGVYKSQSANVYTTEDIGAHPVTVAY